MFWDIKKYDILKFYNKLLLNVLKQFNLQVKHIINKKNINNIIEKKIMHIISRSDFVVEKQENGTRWEDLQKNCKAIILEMIFESHLRFHV